MKRRSFVKKSFLGGAVAAILPTVTKARPQVIESAGQEFYELRAYRLKDAAQQHLVESYWKDAAIPAYNKAGIKNIGVFTELDPQGQTKVFVLIPYATINQFNQIESRLGKNAEYNNKAVNYLNAAATSPAYERLETSLLKAFYKSPTLIVPQRKERIFELRQYQSPTEAAGEKKIEMFNDKGEIDIFKRLGFNPVFWGKTIIGADRPNLTYMLTFDNMDAKGAHWKAFGSDPQWKKISSVPEYADALLVSKIISTLLKPTDYSQI
ncbi:NIPSNAP family protein [Mucilaginibacter litoreus]|uniref:NIPSNAP family protein n=1 Tax=Mucilaginibacter litoreus TaxID=1048221 RepID=A0ABW3AUW0_9SPHI